MASTVNDGEVGGGDGQEHQQGASTGDGDGKELRACGGYDDSTAQWKDGEEHGIGGGTRNVMGNLGRPKDDGNDSASTAGHEEEVAAAARC